MGTLNMDDTFTSLYALVASINETVEALPASVILKEDGRKIARCAKRVETVMFDLQPYVGAGTTALREVLQDIESALMNIVNLVREIGIKGPLASFLQADRMLGGFQQCCTRLDNGLGSIKGRLPQETSEELAAVRALLQRTRFELAPKHAAVVAQFREGVDRMVSAHATTMDACGQILLHVTGAATPLLSRETLENTLRELMSEHALVSASGDPNHDAPYLRTMMDVLRLYHRTADVPVAFTCPLTNQVMQDPATILETGMSYERAAIEDWHKTGHRICPRSGKKLGWRLTLVANNNLKDAIEEWRLFGALSIAWQPILQQLTLGDELQDIYAQAARTRALTPSTSSGGEVQAGGARSSTSQHISQTQPTRQPPGDSDTARPTEEEAATATVTAAAPVASDVADSTTVSSKVCVSEGGQGPLGLNVPSPVVRGFMTQSNQPPVTSSAQDEDGARDDERVSGKGGLQDAQGDATVHADAYTDQLQTEMEQGGDSTPAEATADTAVLDEYPAYRISDSSSGMQAAEEDMESAAAVVHAAEAGTPVAPGHSPGSADQNGGGLVGEHHGSGHAATDVGMDTDVEGVDLREEVVAASSSAGLPWAGLGRAFVQAKEEVPADLVGSSARRSETTPADVVGNEAELNMEQPELTSSYRTATKQEENGQVQDAGEGLGKDGGPSVATEGAPSLMNRDSFDMFAGLGMHSPGSVAQQPGNTAESPQQRTTQENSDDKRATAPVSAWDDASFDAVFATDSEKPTDVKASAAPAEEGKSDDGLDL